MRRATTSPAALGSAGPPSTSIAKTRRCRLPVRQTGYIAGIAGFIAAAAALHRGGGELIDLSETEALALTCAPWAVMGNFIGGRAAAFGPAGGRPRGQAGPLWRTSDGLINYGYGDWQRWTPAMRFLGLDDLAEDERFVSAWGAAPAGHAAGARRPGAGVGIASEVGDLPRPRQAALHLRRRPDHARPACQRAVQGARLRRADSGGGTRRGRAGAARQALRDALGAAAFGAEARRTRRRGLVGAIEQRGRRRQGRAFRSAPRRRARALLHPGLGWHLLHRTAGADGRRRGADRDGAPTRRVAGRGRPGAAGGAQPGDRADRHQHQRHVQQRESEQARHHARRRASARAGDLLAPGAEVRRAGGQLQPARDDQLGRDAGDAA